MSSRQESARDWLELISEYGNDLKRVGVTYMRFGDVVIKLAAPEPAVIIHNPKPENDKAYSDLPPLDDPDTFGGKMPNFHRPRIDEDGEEVVDE